jgi:hypothetical protein
MRHIALLSAALIALAGTVGARHTLPPESLPLIGFGGSTSFVRACPTGYVLTGARARVGVLIDAIGIKCRAVTPNGTLGTETDFGLMAGGSGGGPWAVSCPAGSAIGGQGGMPVMPTGLATFALVCKQWIAATRKLGSVTGMIGVVTTTTAIQAGMTLVSGDNGFITTNRTNCSHDTQPVVQMRGRAGLIVDAVGLTCNEP